MLGENSSRKPVCKILHFNVRSLLPKMDLLHGTCGAQNPDVICVTETWLGEEINNSEISLPGYNIVRLDRHRHSGGVAIYVKNTIDYNVVLCGPENLEFLLVSVNYCNCKLPIGLWYRPPNTPQNRRKLSMQQSKPYNRILSWCILTLRNGLYLPAMHLRMGSEQCCLMSWRMAQKGR